MVKVGRLAAARWQEYRALRLEALKTESAAFGSSYEEEVGHPPEVWQGRIKNCLFAMSGSRPVGMISLVFNGRAKTMHIANIFGFYVTPSSRGKGVGRALLRAAVAGARRNKGVAKVQLSVNPDFRSARALYEEAGFEVTGRARRELKVGGRYHDMLSMELQIR